MGADVQVELSLGWEALATLRLGTRLRTGTLVKLLVRVEVVHRRELTTASGEITLKQNQHGWF